MKKRNEKRKTAAEKDKKKGKWQEAKCRLQVVVLKIEVEKKKYPKKYAKKTNILIMDVTLPAKKCPQQAAVGDKRDSTGNL